MTAANRLVRAAATGWLLSTALLAQSAAAPDKSFEEFFQRFLAEQLFRLDRTADPLRVKIGNPRVGDVRSEKWTRKQAKSELPAPLTGDQLKEKQLDQRVKRHSSTKIEVVQYSPGADVTLLVYTFQRSKGHWVLTHFENASR